MTRFNLLLLFLLIISLASCERIPDAAFYEAEGIVSIKAVNTDIPEGWEVRDLPLTRSLVSLTTGSGTASPVIFQFYLRHTGLYHLGILAASGNTGSGRAMAVTITDQDNFVLENFRPDLPGSTIPEWITANRDGDEMAVQFEGPGFYSIRIEHDGDEGVIIDSIHLSANNDTPPGGMGYPETRSPFSDPVFEKREQIVRIPPRDAFGLIAGNDLLERFSDVKPDMDLNSILVQKTGINREPDMEALASGFEMSKENENDRGFIIYPAPQLDEAEFKHFPALWFSKGNKGFDELHDQLRFFSDELHPAYEIPFFAPLPEWLAGDTPGEPVPGEELLHRWIQLSSLSPIMVLPLPDPGEVYGISDETIRQVETYTELRRKLFPFLYSYTLRARTSGVKTVTDATSRPGAFLYGEELLAVPVTEPGQERMTIRFPEGKWYSWWSGELFEGGQTWVTDVYPDQLPLFVKAGSIIPQRTGNAAISESANDSLLIDVYAGGVSSFRLYEDDGISLNYLNGDFTTTAFRWFEQNEQATFNIGAMVWGRGGDYRRQTSYTLRFRYLQHPSEITANGEPVLMGEDIGEWHYDEDNKSVIIRWLQPSSRRTEFVFLF